MAFIFLLFVVRDTRMGWYLIFFFFVLFGVWTWIVIGIMFVRVVWWDRCISGQVLNITLNIWTVNLAYWLVSLFLLGRFTVIFVWVFVIFISGSSFFSFNAIVYYGSSVTNLVVIINVQFLAIISLLFIVRLILLGFYSLWHVNDFHCS